MSNSVVTNACFITHSAATGEHLKAAAALLAEITAAGGTVRAAANPAVNAREVLGEAVAASNASG
jgi:hypothetical protein